MDTDYLKKVGLYIVSALLSLGVIVYFGYHVWSTFRPEVTCEAVAETTVTKEISAEGYIFRDEAPLTAAASGSPVPCVKNGGKLSVGGEAVKIYSSLVPDAAEALAGIDEQIALLEECTGDTTVTLKDAAKIDAELYSVMTDIRSSLASGSASGAVSRKNALLSGINKKTILTKGAQSVQEQLSLLRNEKKELTDRLGTCLETVKTPRSGYYFADTDGYERVFLPERLLEADYKGILQLVSSSPEPLAGSCGKLVAGSKWYYVCFVDKAVGLKFKEGEERSLGFVYNGGFSMNMKLERLVRGDEGYACVFSSSYMPEGFEYTRCQPVKITMAEYTGFKVRMSAVRLIGGEQGVYVLDGSTVKFRRISVITEDNGSYIVETNPESDGGEYGWLKLHDMLITSGTGLYHGRILGK